MPAPAPAAVKSLYHSALAQMGDVLVTVKSDVMPSKYAGKPSMVTIQVEGVERYYNCENEACEAALTGFKGTTLMLRATGSREDALIETWDPTPEELAAAPAAAAPRAAAAPAQRAAAPRAVAAPARAAAPAQRPAAAAQQQQRATPGPSIKFEDAQMQSEHLMTRALASSNKIAEWHDAAFGLPLDAEQKRAITSSLFITWDRSGYVGQMPVEPIMGDEPPQEGAAQ